MKTLRFYFDPISPYAALAFERLPEALAGCNYSVDYVPILFAGLLKAHGQKGPAEIESKRQWTFRQIAWSAYRLGIPMQTPVQHPFNPLALLRLLWASAAAGQTPGRHAVEQVLRHVWRGDGADANDPARLAALRERLAPPQDPDGEAVKLRLRAATDEALAQGLFGVPTIAVDGRLFWGLDALDMVAACLRDDRWFDGGAWDAAGAPRSGVVR